MSKTQKICQNEKLKHDVKPLSTAVPKGKAVFFLSTKSDIPQQYLQGKSKARAPPNFDLISKKFKSEVNGHGF